jgi:hypothetical protein
MPVATEKINEVQDQLHEFVSRVQEPVARGLRTTAGKIDDRLPEVKIPGLGKTVPTVSELVESVFGFAERIVDNSKRLTGAVQDATASVRHKFVRTSPVKSDPKPSAAKPSAAKVKAA